jgi:inhibitor of KinA sporulation pathway (predicted exonuclease)
LNGYDDSREHPEKLSLRCKGLSATTQQAVDRRPIRNTAQYEMMQAGDKADRREDTHLLTQLRGLLQKRSRRKCEEGLEISRKLIAQVKPGRAVYV